MRKAQSAKFKGNTFGSPRIKDAKLKRVPRIGGEISLWRTDDLERGFETFRELCVSVLELPTVFIDF